MTFAEPLSCVLHAMDGEDFSQYKRVLLVGAGSIGICMAFALYTKGVRFDVLEKSEDRYKRVKRCTLSEPAEGEYDLVLDSSGTPGGMLKACEYLGAGGTLISMSHVDGMKQNKKFLTLFSRKDAILKMPYLNGGGNNMAKAIKLLDEFWIGAWNDLFFVHPGEDLTSLFENRISFNENKSILDCTTIEVIH